VHYLGEAISITEEGRLIVMVTGMYHSKKFTSKRKNV